MIDQAIYSIISAIIDSYPLAGDVDTAYPFAVYGVKTNPVRGKEGRKGETGQILISVFAKRIIETQDKTDDIVNALESSRQSLVETVQFLNIVETSRDYQYDGEDDIYYSEVNFNFITQK